MLPEVLQVKRDRSLLQSATRSCAAATIALATAFTATSCSADQVMPEASVSAASRNLAEWTLPLNPYMPPNWSAVEYAQRVLTKQCMDKTQYDWPFAVETVDPEPGESWNAVSRKLFSPELAAKYGYGNSSETQESKEERAALDAVMTARFPDAGAPDLDRCWARAEHELRSESDPTQLAQKLQFTDESREDRTKKRTTARAWRSCMESLGLPKLPERPEDMWSGPFMDGPSIAQKTSPHPSDPVETRQTTPREIEVATHDAKCQVSSGYQQAAYDAEWNAQLRALEENADALERDRREAGAQRKRALAVISKYAPAGAPAR